MSFTEARVANVTEETAGSELAAAASSSATSIVIVDATDFDTEDGGSLELGGVVMTYTISDEDDPETLTVPALAGAHAVEAPVLISPRVVERFAYVMTPGAEEELVCRVPHALYERLDVGARDPDDPDEPTPESVIATLDDDEWVISDVLDKAPENVARGAVGDGRWELDEAGFRLYSGEDELLVNLPTDEAASPFFAGVLRAIGLDILSSADATFAPERALSWLSADASRRLAYAFAYEEGTADYQVLELVAGDRNADYAALSLFSGGSNPAAVRALTHDTTRVVIDEDAKSDYVQTVTTSVRKLARGKAVLSGGAGVQSIELAAVAHGLGATPEAITATADRALGAGSNLLMATVRNLGATNFDLSVRTIVGSNIGAGNVTVYWMAMS